MSDSVIAKLICVVSVLFALQLTVPAVNAQITIPTAAPTVAPGQTTCDLCGFCLGNPPPRDYERCNSCIHNPDGSAKEGYTYTVVGCLPTTPTGFAQSVLKIVISLAGGVVFLAIIYGGFVVLTSRGDPGRLNMGKGIIVSSIIGMLLLIFSVFLLAFIGFNILGLPGFGG